MQIDITDFFNSCNPSALSASQLELGARAGEITWNNSMAEAAKEPKLLDTEEKQTTFREWVKPWGGWSDEEIAAWNVQELNALFLQWIASDMRESGLDKPNPDWDDYRKGCEAGQYHSSFWRSDDGRIYFSLEH